MHTTETALKGGFEDLKVYQKSRLLRNDIFELCKTFPSEEKYKLIDQITRSSRSITANISEGYGRFHYQENIQYIRISRGSLCETLEHLICAVDCGYMTEKLLEKYRSEIGEIYRMLNGYIKFLKNQKKTSET